MAQPTAYERVYNFTNYQSQSPADPLPGAQVDAELNAVKNSLDETQANLALIQRDDGQLKNDSVGLDQLKAEVEIGVNPPSAWVTLTNYAIADTVTFEAGFYRCLVAHVSGVFATDLAAAKWELIADFASAIGSSSVATLLHAASSKTEPVDADEFLGNDSADTFTLRRFTWANIKTYMVAGIGALLNTSTAKTTPVDADNMLISDSAATHATKKVTFANIKAAIYSALGATVAALTGKTTPVDADTFPISDSAASDVAKKLTWANLKATLFAALGPLIVAATGKTTPVDADHVLLADSAASDAPKKLTWANLKATLLAYFHTTTVARPRRNRLVNPAMQVSQENGNTAGTTTGYYPADQWAKYHVSSAGTLTVQRVQSVTPNGSKDRARITITAADASLDAGEYLTFTQNIEGQEVADLQWGAAAAEQIVVRFGFKGPAGTYAVALHNSGAARSYVALFTISAGQANTDTEQTVIIAGDTSGTWLKDTGIGITLDIVLACGSTFQGATGWQAGNIMGTSGVSNGMATVSDVFEIFDVGLYADPDATGVAPPWEMPGYAETLRKCQRYWEGSSGVDDWCFSGNVTSDSVYYTNGPTYKVSKRASGTLSKTDNLSGFGAITATLSTEGMRLNATASATGLGIFGLTSWSLNARM